MENPTPLSQTLAHISKADNSWKPLPTRDPADATHKAAFLEYIE